CRQPRRRAPGGFPRLAGAPADLGPVPIGRRIVRIFRSPKETPRKRQSKLNWQEYQPQHRLERIDAVGLGLIGLCSRFETIELWTDPRPNDQLQLVCLLHYLRAYPDIASRLSLVQAHIPMGGQMPGVLAKWSLPPIKISQDHFELASRAWRAF